MSNVSIYDKSWIDLVFEDKNKDYGAYQLRRDNPKTTLMALLGGVLFLFSISGLGLFLSSFGEKPDIIINCPMGPTIRPVEFHPETVKPTHPATQPKQPKAPISMAHAVVARTPEVVAEIPKTNAPTTPTSPGTPGEGTGNPVPSGPEGPAVVSAPVLLESKEPVTSNELDKLPQFPGGIERFYQYVGSHLDKPEADESITSVKVIMSFVVEIDGSMTDIKALRSSDKELEKSAIKVLKGLKTKWAPGKKDGASVRTLYVLPIRVDF
jgi:protein TonB